MVHGSDCHSPKLNIRFWFLPLFAGNWLIGRYVRSIHNLILFCFLEFTLFNIRLLVHQAILIYDMVRLEFVEKQILWSFQLIKKRT